MKSKRATFSGMLFPESIDKKCVLMYSLTCCLCLPRLVVRTSGFHPDNGGSIPPGDAKDWFCQSFFLPLHT